MRLLGLRWGFPFPRLFPGQPNDSMLWSEKISMSAADCVRVYVTILWVVLSIVDYFVTVVNILAFEKGAIIINK